MFITYCETLCVSLPNKDLVTPNIWAEKTLRNIYQFRMSFFSNILYSFSSVIIFFCTEFWYSLTLNYKRECSLLCDILQCSSVSKLLSCSVSAVHLNPAFLCSPKRSVSSCQGLPLWPQSELCCIMPRYWLHHPLLPGQHHNEKATKTSDIFGFLTLKCWLCSYPCQKLAWNLATIALLQFQLDIFHLMWLLIFFLWAPQDLALLPQCTFSVTQGQRFGTENNTYFILLTNNPPFLL